MYIHSFFLLHNYRDFHHPQSQEETIRESVGRFLAAIDRSIKWSATEILHLGFHFLMRYLDTCLGKDKIDIM